MSTVANPAEAADLLARQLAGPAPSCDPWQAQSLAEGAAGVALMHIERALGTGEWRTAHAWAKAATSHPISSADTAGLYLGAPAIAFVLHAAGADGTERYARALKGLDAQVAALAHRRVAAAEARIARRERPAFAEYDLFHGLTGIGAHLLRHVPGDAALPSILSYLVRLSEPLSADREALPGWWTFHNPNRRASPEFPGGHANIGMAHGIAGPLALLALAHRSGLTVEGQIDAMKRICAFLDSWRQGTTTGSWWPQWITRHDIRSGGSAQTRPARPSWCYGTPGIARAQQLAAIATGNDKRRRIAEEALAACLADPVQLDMITGSGLCHGWAGVYQTVARASADAKTPAIGAHLPALTTRLTQQADVQHDGGDGLLEGKAGLALALHAAARAAPPVSAWDTCLIIN